MNAAGGVVQANNYYPSGVTMAELPRRSDQGVQPYKFGGKELDRSYGLDFYDFEARAYNPVLMRFTGFDPLASKYPGISPYAYCANNPVNAIDPDGRDVKIYYQDENQKWRSWTFNGKNQDQAPKNQFVSDFVTSYNYNIENGGGDKMQAAATATDYTLNLKQTEGHSNFQTTFNGPRTEGTVFWNPSEGLETSQGTLSPATILEHEMDHGVEWQTNTSEYRKNRNTSDSHFGNLEEKRVITGSEYKTGVANGELKPVPKGKIGNSSSYRRHSRDSKNIFIPVIFPVSNKKKP
jgi:RHS repeat-associated protein